MTQIRVIITNNSTIVHFYYLHTAKSKQIMVKKRLNIRQIVHASDEMLVLPLVAWSDYQ